MLANGGGGEGVFSGTIIRLTSKSGLSILVPLLIVIACFNLLSLLLLLLLLITLVLVTIGFGVVVEAVVVIGDVDFVSGNNTGEGVGVVLVDFVAVLIVVREDGSLTVTTRKREFVGKNSVGELPVDDGDVDVFVLPSTTRDT